MASKGHGVGVHRLHPSIHSAQRAAGGVQPLDTASLDRVSAQDVKLTCSQGTCMVMLVMAADLLPEVRVHSVVMTPFTMQCVLRYTIWINFGPGKWAQKTGSWPKLLRRYEYSRACSHPHSGFEYKDARVQPPNT